MPMLNPQAIDRLIKELNIRSYAALANRLGINRATLSRYLKGKRQPGSRFLDKFKAAFPDRSIEKYLIFTSCVVDECHHESSKEAV